MIGKKAPLSEVPVSDDDELDLEAIIELHRKAGADVKNMEELLSASDEKIELIEDDIELEELDLDLEDYEEISDELSLEEPLEVLDEGLVEEPIEVAEEQPIEPVEEFFVEPIEVAEEQPIEPVEEFFVEPIEVAEEPIMSIVDEPVELEEEFAATDVELFFTKDKISEQELICSTSWKTYDLKNTGMVREVNKKISELLTTEIDEYFSRLIKLWSAETKAYELYEKLATLAQRRAAVNELISTSQQISVERENIDLAKLHPDEIKGILNNLKNIKKIIEKYETIFQKME